MDKWCEIFQAGTHIDHNGSKATWTTKTLDEIVNNFNEKNSDVPIVIGHPKVNSPAYGWVDKLKREGKKLLATFKDVSPEFAEWVNKGFYKTRSISLYGDNTLRHVGWLGGQPPAIKGLASYQFAENENDIKIYDFSDGGLKEYNFKFQSIAKFLTDLREFLIEKYDIETADKVINSWRIEDLKHIDTQDKEEIAAFCEAILNPPDKEKELKSNENTETKSTEKTDITQDFSEAEKVVKEKEDEINKLRLELEAERAEKRKSDYTQFAEQLVTGGNITPAQKSVVIDLMEVCGKSGTYDFAEGDEKSVLNRFKDLLKTCKQIDFAETATKENIKTVETLDFSDPAKASRLIAITAKEKGISEIEAKELLKGGS